MKKVEPFKKISLCFQTDSKLDAGDLQLPGIDVTFVYGIGSGGLTPFECLLADKPEGADISLRVAKAEETHFFGHLLPSAAALFAGHAEVSLRARIARIQTAEPREIIRAMADMTAHGHGSGCDCGCGCG